MHKEFRDNKFILTALLFEPGTCYENGQQRERAKKLKLRKMTRSESRENTKNQNNHYALLKRNIKKDFIEEVAVIFVLALFFWHLSEQLKLLQPNDDISFFKSMLALKGSVLNERIRR